MNASTNQVKPSTPNLFAIESYSQSLSAREWDLLEKLRAVRRKLDGSTPVEEKPCGVSPNPVGVLERISLNISSQDSAQGQLFLEIELLEALVG